MREDGSVEKFDYSRTKAPSSGSEAFRDAITQYEAFRDKRDKERTDAYAAVRAEELAGIDHQISLLTKQDALTKLRNPSAPGARQLLDDQAALLNAEVALLTAKLEKKKAEAALVDAAE